MKIRADFWLLLARLAIMSFLLAGTFSCFLGGGGSDPSLDFEEIRVFNAQTLSGSWQTVTAHLRYVGTHCVVYVEENESARIPDSVIVEIGEAFDTRAFPVVKQYFGEPYDVDGNGKVILLLLDIQDGYTEGSGGYVAGYFDYSHMYAVSTFSYSNQADMIFLDTYPGLRTASGKIDPAAKEDLKLTLAHEFQHLVNYSEKVIKQKKSQMDTWINEGLSAAAEYLYLGKHVPWKIEYFNQVQYQFSLKGSYNPLKDANLWGQYFVSWGVWGDPLVNYSTVYLFFQWLRIQAEESSGSRPEIYKTILQDENSDYRAVVNAFNSYTGVSRTWKEIFMSWLFANLLNHPTGLYGYRNQLTDSEGKVAYLYPRIFCSLPSDTSGVYARSPYPPFSVSDTNAGKAFLLPGDAVYVQITEDKSLSDTSAIAYGSTDLSSEPTVGEGLYTGGEVLLASNIKGLFDGYVYSTDKLLTPGTTLDIGISTITPPASIILPRDLPKSMGTFRSKSIHQRPFPMDALLGTEEPAKSELSFVVH